MNVAVHVMNVDHRQAAVTFRPIQLIRALSQLAGYYLSTPTFIKSRIPISRRPEGGGTCVQPMLKAVFHSFFCDIHTTRSGLSEIWPLGVWQSLAVVVLVSAVDQVSPAGLWTHYNIVVLTYLLVLTRWVSIKLSHLLQLQSGYVTTGPLRPGKGKG